MASRHGSAIPSQDPANPEVQYTLLVRVPFPRGDFVDPPQVYWDATKDQALWEHISRSSKTSDLDWQALAAAFDVPHAFLLQQAAWLYERHLLHVRAQMRRVAPNPGASAITMVGGLPMKRTGSGGGSRTQSSLSTRPSDGIGPRASIADGNGSGTPRPTTGLSRNPSTATVTQSRHTRAQDSVAPPSPRQPGGRPLRTSYGFGAEGRRTSEQRQAEAVPEASKGPIRSTATSPAESDSTNSSDSDEADKHVPTGIRASQIVRRGPAWLTSQKQKLGTVEDESPEREGYDDDDDDETLPFAAATTPSSRQPGLRAASPQRKQRHLPEACEAPSKQPSTSKAGSSTASPSKRTPPPPQTQQQPPPPHSTDPSSSRSPPIPESTDSASSASSLPQTDGPSGTRPAQRATPGRRPNALSPRQSHRAQLGRIGSGGSRGSGGAGAVKQEGVGSEGTPSMGSSFSDLDDASISQSALEEALLSKMQGGAASRVSNFSTALRSKYLH